MGETYDAVKDRDENKPEIVHAVSVRKFHDHNSSIVTSLNNSLSLSTSLNSDSNSSSKSGSPDHVVPSNKNPNSPHRLSTSSGASSPQTDGSISYRRTSGTDVSRNGTTACSGPESASERSPQNCRTIASTAKCKRKQSARKKVKAPKNSKKKLAKSRAQEEDSDGDYVIRCICGFSDMFDKQIQCEQCEVWQHFGCMGIEPATVPDCYLCEVCDPHTFRPLQSDEARELHRSLMPRDSQQPGSNDLMKAKTGRRKKSADSGTPQDLTPRQPDLIQSDKKRAEVRSRQSSVEAAVNKVVCHRIDDYGELSRDDRKILQYEQMFKRMEERRDKKEKRKRTHDDASMGSPTRESTREREHVDEESHHSPAESINPPLSPPLASIIDFPPPLPTCSDPVSISEPFPIPACTNNIINTSPTKLLLKAKRMMSRAKSVVERIADKELPSLETLLPPIVEKEKTEGVETPTASTQDQKPRFSLRLRNNAVNRLLDSAEEPNTRIELNSMKKKKKDGDIFDDLDMGMPMVMLPLNKRRIRTVSFIDAYYSSMADVQTETDMQKAARRNRAYSASEEFEQSKLTAERCRLYRLYGMKKGVCARYREDEESKLLSSSASDCSSVFDNSTHPIARLADLADVPHPPTQSCLARYGGVLPLKRSRTVRAMIEESIQKNHGEERAHQVGQTARKEWMSATKKQSDVPRKSDVLQRMMGLEKQKTRPVMTNKKLERSGLSDVAAGAGGGLGSSRSADLLSKSPNKNVVQRSDVEMMKAPQLTAHASVQNVHPALLTQKTIQGQKEQNAPVALLPTSRPDITPADESAKHSARVTPSKKLSLAEYRQRKMEQSRVTGNPVEAIGTLPVTLNPPNPMAPSSSIPPHPVSTVASSSVPKRTSVIQRIGSAGADIRMETPPVETTRPEKSPHLPPVKNEKSNRLTAKNLSFAPIPERLSKDGQDEKNSAKMPGSAYVQSAPVPYVQTHFRPAPMLASRSSSVVDSMKSLNMV